MAKKPTKPKQCKVCEVLFIPQYTSLQVTCSIKCTIEFNSEKEVKKRVQQMKVEVEGTTQLEKAARIIFQQWIRERDKYQKCISCKNTNADIGPKMWDAGHYFSADKYSGLIFDEDNVHKQCKFCNGTLMHGNLAEYRKGLIERYGEDFMFQLESISDVNREYKYSRSELIDIANKYKMKRIEKEEAAKKTAELNALASETVTEELTPEQNEKFEKYIEEGDKLHKTKDYHSAILQYKLALAMKPNDKAANNKVLKCQNWIDKLKAKNDIEETH